MTKFVIGVDPDSKAHGVAVYENGKLIELHSLNTPRLSMLLQNLKQFGSLIVSIEDNESISAMYTGRFKNKDSEAVKSKKAQHVGMVKQAQREVEYWCEILGIQVVKQKPSKQWKDANDKQFKLATKWQGRSNEDSRSAAYMGFLAINGIKVPKLNLSESDKLINQVMR
ncbi:hypothetical protein VCSRO111_0601 [Vibrio cholerae]|uniref:hypothetical protein n=1 Tax=Vibrio cholerae TaxID=666 RepID=UPI0011D8706F|nr:hypothetical protein [Vibrio cholerae]TXY57634.1 hypothetical protein FXE91_10765 [Vibrio cholerae]GHX89528.1 hypothetical protein VCSRO111_0601 [Vibrio cholerae]